MREKSVDAVAVRITGPAENHAVPFRSLGRKPKKSTME